MQRRKHRAPAIMAIALGVLLTNLGCSSEEPEPQSGGLGIDDGASAGVSTSALVTGEKEVVLELSTGAQVKVAQGAVDKEVTLGLERPKDAKAKALVKSLEDHQKIASAPYVVTPHGTKFKADVEITLPVATGKDQKKLKVVWLEDEEDKQWKTLTKPKVEAGKATFKVAHFSVLLLVEDHGTALADPGGGLPASNPGAVVLSKFPIDLERDCPASGCTIQLDRVPYDGVWVDCVHTTDPASFDLQTFDFAAACANTVPASEGVSFVHGGVEHYPYVSGSSECDSVPLRLDAMDRLYEAWCDAAEGVLETEDNHIMRDGVLYYGWYEPDEVSPSLSVRMLQPADTTELRAQCAKADDEVATCPALGVTLPFGPSGVGPMPAALADTLWLSCQDEHENPPSACASVLDGSASYIPLVRFRADGTVNELEKDTADNTWSSSCERSRVGGSESTLRYFYCDGYDDEWEAWEETWEIQTISGTDYLLLDEGDSDGPSVFVRAPSDFTVPAGAQDPCAEAPALHCVID